MIHNIQYTRHADIRSQQRGIDHQLVEHLLSFGKKAHCAGGALRYYFTPERRLRLKRKISSTDYARIESKLNSYAVISNDGAVVTVGRRTKRIKH